MRHARYVIPAIVIVVVVGVTARVTVERRNAPRSEQSPPIKLAQTDSLERTKLCAAIAENIVPALYGDVQKWGVSRAIAAWESSRDEMLASDNPDLVARTKKFAPFVPGVFKHVAAAYSMLGRVDGQGGVDAKKHASDTYMTSCLLLGPENVK